MDGALMVNIFHNFKNQQNFSDEEKETLRTTFSEASDWLWDVEDPTAVDYQDKLAELKKSTKSWLKRVDESNKRPEAIERLQVLFNIITSNPNSTFSDPDFKIKNHHFRRFQKSDRGRTCPYPGRHSRRL